MTELCDASSIFIGWVNDLEILALLSSCSRELRDHCSCGVRQRFKSFLPGIVSRAPVVLQRAEAAAMPSDGPTISGDKHVEMLGWLCGVAGPEAICSGWRISAAAITSIPNVPSKVAKVLVAAGVRLTLSQLKEGCAKRVPGVEVWVKACQVLSLDSGLPAAEQAICCSNTDALVLALADEQPERAAADRIIHLLQIALNMQSCEAAMYILFKYKVVLKAKIQPTALHDLLCTAYGRWGPDEYFFARNAHNSIDTLKCYRHEVIRELCSFPSAQKLTPEDVGELIRHAVRNDTRTISDLQTLRGAQHITEQVLDDLLLESVGFHEDETLEGFSQLGAAIDPDTWLTVVISGPITSDTDWLLGPTPDFNARQAAAFMIAFLQISNNIKMAHYIIESVAGARQMLAEQWLDVLRAYMVAVDYPITTGREGLFLLRVGVRGLFAQSAWRLPAVQQLDRAAVCGLLQQAVLLGRQGFLSDDFVKLLTPDQAPDAGALGVLLQTALRHQNQGILIHICQQQWAQSLQKLLATESASSRVMTAALIAANLQDSSSNENPSSQLLQAAMGGDPDLWQQFGVDPLEVALHRALANEKFDTFLSLCKQVSAGQLCPHGVVTLLAAAVATDYQPVPEAVMEAMHSLLLQAGVDVVACMTAQLHIAIQLRRDALAAALCRMHNPQLSPEQCEDLLRRAAQMGCHQTVTELCRQAELQDAIECRAVYRLLLLTIATFSTTMDWSAFGTTLSLLVRAFLSLPAARCLGEVEAASLMKLAINRHWGSVFHTLTSIPVVQRFSMKTVSDLYNRALQQPLATRITVMQHMVFNMPHTEAAVAEELCLLLGGAPAEWAMQNIVRSKTVHVSLAEVLKDLQGLTDSQCTYTYRRLAHQCQM